MFCHYSWHVSSCDLLSWQRASPCLMAAVTWSMMAVRSVITPMCMLTAARLAAACGQLQWQIYLCNCRNGRQLCSNNKNQLCSDSPSSFFSPIAADLKLPNKLSCQNLKTVLFTAVNYLFLQRWEAVLSPQVLSWFRISVLKVTDTANNTL